jgi:hypothetical protein
MLKVIRRVAANYALVIQSERLVVYHGTNLSRPPTLRAGSYTTTEFLIAASYGKDKNPDHFWVYEYVVEDPFELVKFTYGTELKMVPKYNHDMGHDAYLNQVPIKPSGKKWEFVEVSDSYQGEKHWGRYYRISPQPPI